MDWYISSLEGFNKSFTNIQLESNLVDSDLESSSNWFESVPIDLDIPEMWEGKASFGLQF